MNIIINIINKVLIINLFFFIVNIIGKIIEISKSKMIKIIIIEMKLIFIDLFLLLKLLNPHSIEFIKFIFLKFINNNLFININKIINFKINIINLIIILFLLKIF